ncbi:YeeE/YedE thiosulfate transporter family protein [Alteromonas sp. ASW11-36]|uniref:YeeE/YedE thiosulfate transporter family protein n=1 Tax=Alteromonas arenosi TaxID=3055817 RepID=A0ABT7SSY8_9ALTE|nr:YeeE/YedE thiosulfate transporter family protein [Alteromonas sp. ASW11-36]MDM7859308.1 YeeE/YedE thiosulfate transporter family protein [Alteromonas sp. ASW11-36]
MTDFIEPLIGGVILGVSSLLLLVANGRIAGISGIVSNLLKLQPGNAWRWMFVIGLILGPVVLQTTSYNLPNINSSWWMLIAGGLLVGFGSVFGSGCTSGHGICGIGRLSPRSITSVVIFMATAAITVFVTRHLLGAA